LIDQSYLIQTKAVMPLKKKHKKELTPKNKDFVGDTIHHGRIPNDKQKYKGKNRWLDELDDDDYVSPKYKDEEE